jgi:hypothetical protein
MAATHRIHVTLGQDKFEAEGQEELVNDQYEKFLSTIALLASSRSQQQPEKLESQGEIIVEGSGTNLLERAFLVDKDGIVSLKALPKTANRDADALVLILYGFKSLGQEKDVIPVLALLAGARQSGLQIDRVDRTIAPNISLVNKGGQKRGGRYSLNNAGIAYAEKLLREMF